MNYPRTSNYRRDVLTYGGRASTLLRNTMARVIQASYRRRLMRRNTLNAARRGAAARNLVRTGFATNNPFNRFPRMRRRR